MASVLITGSNRGLGLEWVRQLAQAGWRVYATCRHPDRADVLNGLAREHSSVSVHCLDVTRPGKTADLASELAGHAGDHRRLHAGGQRSLPALRRHGDALVKGAMACPQRFRLSMT